MKPYLVDVPVSVNVWIRPECQRRQFEIIKQARPSILFFFSDNGRTEEEKRLVSESRKIVEKIDWECAVYRIYEEENLGLYTMSRKQHNYIWSHVDRCILLEDDILPSVSYFRFCAELLEYYKDDLRVNAICGMNHLGICKEINSDYFFSRQGSIWGVALWKRTYECFNDFEYGKDPYVCELLVQRTKRNRVFRKRIKAYANQKYYEGHVAWAEFFIEFGMYGQNQLQIIPKKNMIKNIGCTANAEHSAEVRKLPHGIRRVFNMETYEIDFPLNHARYVIPDVSYEKARNKIMAYNYPWRLFYRKIEAIFLRVKYKDFYGVKEIIMRQARKAIKVQKNER